ncbi:MAG: hypothetical protein GHCLOJNM_03639 [bacterium]|nr:hypothetical protein [bacterium]
MFWLLFRLALFLFLLPAHLILLAIGWLIWWIVLNTSD